MRKYERLKAEYDAAKERQKANCYRHVHGHSFEVVFGLEVPILYVDDLNETNGRIQIAGQEKIDVLRDLLNDLFEDSEPDAEEIRRRAGVGLDHGRRTCIACGERDALNCFGRCKKCQEGPEFHLRDVSWKDAAGGIPPKHAAPVMAHDMATDSETDAVYRPRIGEHAGNNVIVFAYPDGDCPHYWIEQVIGLSDWIVMDGPKSAVSESFDSFASAMGHLWTQASTCESCGRIPPCPSCNVPKIRNGDEFVCDNPKCELRGVA